MRDVKFRIVNVAAYTILKWCKLSKLYQKCFEVGRWAEQGTKRLVQFLSVFSSTKEGS
jgi:hypothetical protein